MRQVSPALSAFRLDARAAFSVATGVTFVVGAYLRLADLGQGGLGNPFYAAAVRSMTKSLHNFVFASFDPLGTFSVDKPPLALWLQALSALVFGYGGFALVLPQALAGIAAIILLFSIVWRLHGQFFALTASLALAVLPASVLVSRNNTMDTLVMALSLGSLALTAQAVKGTSLRPLVLAGFLVGLAFNTKGFEAFVALPAILAFFWLASPLPWRPRLGQLTAFAAAAAVVGLSWMTAVSLIPASDRPLVLNSNGNSIWDLTFRYNGLDRLFGGGGFNPANALTTSVPNMVPLGVLYGGERGPMRVFGDFPGPLVAAVLPATLAGAALFALDLRDPRRRPAAALWLLWLAAGLTAFSASRLGSPHYLEAFSPAVAVCFGYAAWTSVSDSSWRRLLVLAGAAGSAVYVLERLSHLGSAGGYIFALGLAALASAALALVLTTQRASTWSAPVAFAPFACILATSFVVSLQAIRDAPIEGVQPGLVLLSEDKGRALPFNPASPAYSFLTGRYDYLSRPLSYVKTRAEPGRYALGVRTLYMAAAMIAQNDLAVLPLYSEFRNRPELPPARLRALVDQSGVQYFLVSPAALSGSYAEALTVIETACPDNVSRLAGLPPQTGLQLLRCH